MLSILYYDNFVHVFQHYAWKIYCIQLAQGIHEKDLNSGGNGTPLNVSLVPPLIPKKCPWLLVLELGGLAGILKAK